LTDARAAGLDALPAARGFGSDFFEESGSGLFMFALTFDIDWAPDEVIADTLELLAASGVKATFFATHKSPLLEGFDRERFEVGLHPNFNPILEGSQEDFRRPVDALLAAFPSSRGVRSHSLVAGTQIIGYFMQAGLKYDSNILLPYQCGLKPFYHCSGLVRIPYFWEDDVHMAYGRPPLLADISLSPGSLHIFDFHPVHVFLNTFSESHYAAAKRYYQEPRALLGLRNTERPGVRDLLVELLEYVRAYEVKTVRLIDVAERAGVSW
jgi:hypothetical protein